VSAQHLFWDRTQTESHAQTQISVCVTLTQQEFWDRSIGYVTKRQKGCVKHKQTQTTLFWLSDRFGPPKIDVVYQSVLCAYLTRCLLQKFPINHDSCGTFGVLGVAPVHPQGAKPANAAAVDHHIW
jgi:hypothetical protein